MSKLNVLIAGASGYLGIELTKILIRHKKVKIKYLCGNSSIGKKITFFDKSLPSTLPKLIKFDKKLLKNVDLVFTALPNGQSQKISNHLLDKNKLIDLSADFRLSNPLEYKKWYKIKHSAINNIKKSIYALPEIKKKNIRNYSIIACPGCYPTSVILPVAPLIKNNLINNTNIIIDSKSGYSGAGRGVHKKYKNKNLYESLSAYGLALHRHNSEIQQELDIFTNRKNNFHFTPHLTPMFRGILSTIYLDLKKKVTINKVISVLKKHYKRSPFVKIAKMNTYLSTNNVINTNNCIISVCKSKYKNKIIILCAIDNLLKGGSGQAVQNMNILYNFKETESLNV